jgi:predicted kinase
MRILIGMIASGKSTYCKARAKQGDIIINDDTIVNLVHGNDYTLYEPKLKMLYKSIENHIIMMGAALQRNIIVDSARNLNINTRKRWIALARTIDLPCIAVIFPMQSPEIHAQRRFEYDNRGHNYDYWLKVAQAHYNSFVIPSLNEGFNDIQQGSI